MSPEEQDWLAAMEEEYDRALAAGYAEAHCTCSYPADASCDHAPLDSERCPVHPDAPPNKQAERTDDA